jgi:AcrR family transcriptional regulator
MRAMNRFGPSQLTLGHVASEAGLTPGALVQRFGSKRALLLTLMQRFSGSARDMFDALRASAVSPLDTIYAYARCMAQMGETPDALARNFAWLQQDLTDPEFRQYLLVHARATRRELQGLVRDAIDARELRGPLDAAVVARALDVTVTGSLMTWAIFQEGTAVAWVQHDVEAALRPWVVGRAKRRSTL